MPGPFSFGRGRAKPGTHSMCRTTIQDVGNILGALYLSMLFLGIINSRTVQPVAAAERAVGLRCLDTSHASYQPWLSASPINCAMHALIGLKALPKSCAPRALGSALTCVACCPGDVQGEGGGNVQRATVCVRAVPDRGALQPGPGAPLLPHLLLHARL